MENKSKSGSANVVTIAVLAALTAVLDMFGVFGLPVGILSVSSFYFASAFYLLFVEVFRWRGAIASYIGLLLASVFTTGFSVMPLLLAWGNVVCNVFVVGLMRRLDNDYKCDKVWKAATEVLLLLIAPAISGLWILGGYVVFGIMPVSALPAAVFAWWFAGSLVYLIIGIPLMKFVMPLFRRFRL